MRRSRRRGGRLRATVRRERPPRRFAPPLLCKEGITMRQIRFLQSISSTSGSTSNPLSSESRKKIAPDAASTDAYSQPPLV